MKRSAGIFILLSSLIFIAIVLEISLRLFPGIDMVVNDPYRYVISSGKHTCGIPFSAYKEKFPVFYDKRGYYKISKGIITYYFDQFGARWIDNKERDLTGENIIVIGDSLTFGYGLRYEDTYIFKTQHSLEQDNIHINFVNLSMPAANSKICQAIYMRNKDKIPHSMLIYGLHLNDLIQFPSSYIACNVPKKDNFVSIFYNYTKKSRLAEFTLNRLVSKKDREEKILELTHPSRLNDDYFINNMDAIKKMYLEAKNSNVEFFVVILPMLVDVKTGTFKPAYDRIKYLLDTNGIRYFDLTESVSTYKDPELWIMPFDQHPNELANTLFSDKLSAMLKDAKNSGTF